MERLAEQLEAEIGDSEKTPQGKVNRAALIASPPPENLEHTPAPNSTLASAPKDSLELALASLWQSLLPSAAVSSARATFAELGGDSLQVVRLMLGVKEITGQPRHVVSEPIGRANERATVRRPDQLFDDTVSGQDA